MPKWKYVFYKKGRGEGKERGMVDELGEEEEKTNVPLDSIKEYRRILLGKKCQQYNSSQFVIYFHFRAEQTEAQ